MRASELDGQARVVVSAEQIDHRLTELARQVESDYAGKDVVLIGVLKGAMMVMADFSRELRLPVEIDWMAVASYGSGTSSSGMVRILKDIDVDIRDRHVIIVEDVLDSGLTLQWLVAQLNLRGPASLEMLALVRKPDAITNDVNVRYVGFDLSNQFIVGYGMDHAQQWRNLAEICVLED